MLDSLLTKKQAVKHPNQHHIKKRHWCLGTVVILVGSWITHTTTANIADEMAEQKSPVLDAISALDSALAEPTVTLELAGDQTELLDDPRINPSWDESRYKVRRGDSIGSIFKAKKLDLSLPYKISQHETARQLVSLSIGRELTFYSAGESLKELHYPINKLQTLEVSFDELDVGNAKIVDLPYKLERKTSSGEINSSLYETAQEVGLSNGMIMEMVRIFGWDIDFVQDIRGADNFHIIYEDYVVEGEKIADGDILAAEFTTQGKSYRAIRFEDEQGEVSYYNPQGESMLGTFLRSPVEFSRISSRFGRRKHPILKKWRAHKGVDYAASRGTPIRATADGKVVSAGNKGGYGKAVVLRHAGRFSTLYGHMNGFGKGVRGGSRVKQGQVIGYIGSTGLATGPHLHYEFRVDGVHRNPLTYKTPKASAVKVELQGQFSELVKNWASELNQAEQSFQQARASSSGTAAM